MPSELSTRLPVRKGVDERMTGVTVQLLNMHNQAQWHNAQVTVEQVADCRGVARHAHVATSRVSARNLDCKATACCSQVHAMGPCLPGIDQACPEG